MRSNTEWRSWGRLDPLYGVATHPGKARTDPGAWTEDEFFALGAREWADYFLQWKSFGVTTHSCLEIGCGAGRITQQLVQTFGKVYALDVSPDMIAYARTHVQPADKVSYFVTNGVDILLPDKSVSGVFSCQVFQHFDSVTDSVPYWQNIYRVLQPGGTVFIQLPIHKWPWMPSVFGKFYGARRFVGSMVAWIRRRRLEAGSQQLFVRVVSYDADWLLHTLANIGYERTELRCISQPGSPAYWAVLAARPHQKTGIPMSRPVSLST